MNSSIKKIFLFVIILVLSYLTASYVGSWYNTISPQYGDWIVSSDTAVFFAGFVISYIFFVPLIYGLFGIKQNKHWVIWPLLPAVLLMLAADKSHFYIPVLLIITALALAKLINFIVSKLRRPNQPIVAK